MTHVSGAVGYVDATLRDLAPFPWGTAVGTDDLAAAAAALSEVGARVLEALDARCVRAALEARSESPWDRLRAVLREAGGTPVGVVIGARNLWGDVPLAPDVVRRFVLCAVDSGASRIRATDPLNDPDALLLAPEQAYFVRENLKQRLRNARLALLSRQFDTSQADLQSERTTIERYFDRNARKVGVEIELLRQVAGQARQVSLPRPYETLAALATANAGH